MTINEDALNMSVRKFLKKVGITSQREIERAVHQAVEEGRFTNDTTHTVRVTLDLGSLDDPIVITGDIQIEFSD